MTWLRVKVYFSLCCPSKILSVCSFIGHHFDPVWSTVVRLIIMGFLLKLLFANILSGQLKRRETRGQRLRPCFKPAKGSSLCTCSKHLTSGFSWNLESQMMARFSELKARLWRMSYKMDVGAENQVCVDFPTARLRFMSLLIFRFQVPICFGTSAVISFRPGLTFIHPSFTLWDILYSHSLSVSISAASRLLCLSGGGGCAC